MSVVAPLFYLIILKILCKDSNNSEFLATFAIYLSVFMQMVDYGLKDRVALITGANKII